MLRLAWRRADSPGACLADAGPLCLTSSAWSAVGAKVHVAPSSRGSATRVGFDCLFEQSVVEMHGMPPVSVSGVGHGGQSGTRISKERGVLFVARFEDCCPSTCLVLVLATLGPAVGPVRRLRGVSVRSQRAQSPFVAVARSR